MFPYWLLFFILAAGAFMSSRSQVALSRSQVALRGGGGDAVQHNDFFLHGALLLVLVMIGLRYEVGGDWDAYLQIFHSIGSRELDRAFVTSAQEPGYTLLNWIVARAGLEIWLVNLFCAVPFVAGLLALCRQQPNPWLALVIATPLFVIAIGMGYTRQAAGAGFLLIGLTKLLEGRSLAVFVIWALLGALFHQSVLILVPLVALFLFQGRLGSIILTITAIMVSYFVLLPVIFGAYSSGYIRATYEAQGAIFRLVLNAFAAVFVLSFPDRFHASYVEKQIWRGWAVMALASLVAFFLVPSSVILDRLAVYIIPLQIYALARLPTAFGHRDSPSLGLTAMVIAYSSAVLFAWLTFANNATYWIPYRLYPLG